MQLADWGLVLQGPQERVETIFRRLDSDRDGKLQPREWRDALAASIVESIQPGRGGELTRAEVLNFYQSHRNYLSLESTHALLESFLSDAALEAAKDTHLRAAPTLVYLANGIAAGGAEIPYSVVAALDPTLTAPLGPFLPRGVKQLGDDEIVLADWKESPLPRPVGEKVTLAFLPPTPSSPSPLPPGGGEGKGGEQQEQTATFRLAGFLPLRGVAADPDLTPEFPGITDKPKLREWKLPFEQTRTTRTPDEHYWRDYRTTPKAYVNLSVGQRLWGSRFGRLTSIRLAATKGQDLADSAETFERALRDRLDPAKGGFVFNPVKEQALRQRQGQ